MLEITVGAIFIAIGIGFARYLERRNLLEKIIIMIISILLIAAPILIIFAIGLIILNGLGFN